MRMLIMIIATIFEVAFMIYCIKTRDNQSKARNRIRLAAFITFVVAALTSIIEWGFRYTLLGVVLLIFAAIGLIGLIRNKEETKTYSTGRIVRKAILTLLILSIATAPAILLPQYRPIEQTGAYEVAGAAYTYTDDARLETYTDTGDYRVVNVEFWYPKNGDGTYPLIVFSHGMFGIKMSNESIFRELASHGYVVCSIDHPFQSFYTKNEDGEVTIVDKGYMNDYNEWSVTKDYIRAKEIMDGVMYIRTADMNFVIDKIIQQKASGDAAPYNLVDTEKIGVSGHSMGGSAALELGRQRNDVTAVMALESPFFGDVLEATAAGYVYDDEPYPVPMLNVYTDSTWLPGGLDSHPVYAQNKYYLSYTKATVHNVYFQGANHMSVTDLALFMPFMADMLSGGAGTMDKYYCLETLNSISLDYFNCYLKGEGVFAPDGKY